MGSLSAASRGQVTYLDVGASSKKFSVKHLVLGAGAVNNTVGLGGLLISPVDANPITTHANTTMYGI